MPSPQRGFAQRVALFAAALQSTDALTWLAGLREAEREPAEAMLHELAQLDSGSRQARLTFEFGPRPDALARLQALVVDAPPALRSAIGHALPPSAAAHFPHLRGASPPTSPALRGLALRLVREAMR